MKHVGKHAFGGNPNAPNEKGKYMYIDDEKWEKCDDIQEGGEEVLLLMMERKSIYIINEAW